MKRLRNRLTASQMDSIFAVLCILPAFIGLTIVVFAPIVKALFMSFQSYKITSTAKPVWNNFANYSKLFESGDVWQYLMNTIVFIVLVVAIQFVLAMVIGLLLNSKQIKGRNVLRAVYMIPWTIPSVVTALLWAWMLQPQYGVLNWLFYNTGLQENLNQLWVQDPTYAMPSVIMACVWRQTPYMMVMLLAGLQSVPGDLVEAAHIDGANAWKRFIKVILPSIRPVIDTSIVVSVITNAQMFTIIYNMTAGGPIGKTTTFSVGAYMKAFVSFDFGQGSALGMIWLVILTVAIFFYRRHSDKKISSYLQKVTSMKRKKILKAVAIYVPIVLLLIVMLFPIYWMVSASFRHNSELVRFPPNFSLNFNCLDNYVRMFGTVKYMTYFKNSVITATGSVIFSVLISLLASFSFSRYKIRFKNALMTSLMNVQIFPPTVIIISLFTFFSSMQLLNTYKGLILADLIYSLPFTVWFLKAFMDTVPRSLDEAAKIDGCNRLQILTCIILPVVRPGVIAISIYTFLYAWDDFVFAQTIMSKDVMKTLPVGMAQSFIGEYVYDYASMMTLSVLASLPVIVAFMFAESIWQRALPPAL